MKRLAGLRFAPGLMCGAAFIWAGTRVSAANIPLALLMMAIGVMTLVLVVRIMLEARTSADRIEWTGELTTPNFDYLIWVAVLVPMLLVVALLILAVTGGLTNS